MRRSALAPFACLLGSACAASPDSAAESDDVAPELRDARFVDGGMLRLSFSEAMAPASEVDPAAFRLSLGVFADGLTVYYGLTYDHADGGPGPGGTGDPGGDDGTDPTGYDPTGYDPTGYDPTGYDDSSYARPLPWPQLSHPIAPLRAADIAVTAVRGVEGEETDLELRLASDVTQTTTCDRIDEALSYGEEAAIFLHYRAPSEIRITDLAGNALASIGEQWVVQDTASYVEVDGRFPQLDPHLPIACP